MKNKGSIIAAFILIAIGSWFLSIELVPGLKEFAYDTHNWPINVIGIGVLFALAALVSWTPGLMIPACIIAGIGGLLYWQNLTGNWTTWAYAWALIPGFVGVGILLAGLMQRDRRTLTGGGWTIFNSMVLFIIFGAFLGGGEQVFQFWPVLLIVLGVIMLGRGFLRR
jgi:hypothetical protein